MVSMGSGSPSLNFIVSPYCFVPFLHRQDLNSLLISLSTLDRLAETLCTIWYPLYNLKIVKNTHRGVLLLLSVTSQLYFSAASLDFLLSFTSFYILNRM